MKKILIANRGEIAIRIAKASKELGLKVVGLYTNDEKEAPHLKYCDIWVLLEGKTLAETYLNSAQLVKIAQDYQVDLVHPGYGFLSENYLFAQQLDKAGIKFVGPHYESIHMMGDKGRSKELARKAKVPTIPGDTKTIESLEELKIKAKTIGYPILLKAVSGGGGRGMRKCFNESELAQAFESTVREAQNSFGDGNIILEKFIEEPHHIEVQVFGDGKGKVLHFFERECSVQRRNQKILEEAPSPFIGTDEDLRNKICNYAVSLAQFVNYKSAGTIEFIVDKDKNIYFLEMNTRIQVEHPITESITGYDLVRLMIEFVLAGEVLHLQQKDIRHFGHSIEARICAEDSVKMLPSFGTITGLDCNFPVNTRFDHILEKGLKIIPNYDNMLGKLVVFASDRQKAIQKLAMALNGLTIHGLQTNIPLQKDILKKQSFLQGDYSTHFLVKENLPNQSQQDISEDKIGAHLAIHHIHLMRS